MQINPSTFRFPSRGHVYSCGGGGGGGGGGILPRGDFWTLIPFFNIKENATKLSDFLLKLLGKNLI